MKYIRCTLVQILKGDQILLGKKRRGFGVNKWNGFGGKLQKNESVKCAAAREVLEECNLQVNEKDLLQIGILMFEVVERNLMIEINIFKTTKFSGEPQESEEMTPKWFQRKTIPYSEMWADDIHWYPFIFENQSFFGYTKFTMENVMLYKNFKIVNDVIDMNRLKKKFIEDFDDKFEDTTTLRNDS